MTTEIYYFSGTGNSLHVAKELQKRLPGAALVPMAGLLNQEAIEISADMVGFVFPLHLTTVPVPVREFLKRIRINKCDYIFAVATRIGTICLADLHIERALKKLGRKLDAFFILNMANNSPTGLKPTPGDRDWDKQIAPEKVAALEAEVQRRLDAMRTIIVNREPYDKERAAGLHKRLMGRMLVPLIERGNTVIPYYADQSCSGCGTCAKVCPAKRIKLIEGRPAWQEEIKCYYCYACFNFCPQQAILVGKRYTEKKGRYRHPEVTAEDIAGQKRL